MILPVCVKYIPKTLEVKIKTKINPKINGFNGIFDFGGGVVVSLFGTKFASGVTIADDCSTAGGGITDGVTGGITGGNEEAGTSEGTNETGEDTGATPIDSGGGGKEAVIELSSITQS